MLYFVILVHCEVIWSILQYADVFFYLKSKVIEGSAYFDVLCSCNSASYHMQMVGSEEKQAYGHDKAYYYQKNKVVIRRKEVEEHHLQTGLVLLASVIVSKSDIPQIMGFYNALNNLPGHNKAIQAHKAMGKDKAQEVLVVLFTNTPFDPVYNTICSGDQASRRKYCRAYSA